jgi:hypothetical protein
MISALPPVRELLLEPVRESLLEPVRGGTLLWERL